MTKPSASISLNTVGALERCEELSWRVRELDEERVALRNRIAQGEREALMTCEEAMRPAKDRLDELTHRRAELVTSLDHPLHQARAELVRECVGQMVTIWGGELVGTLVEIWRGCCAVRLDREACIGNANEADRPAAVAAFDRAFPDGIWSGSVRDVRPLRPDLTFEVALPDDPLEQQLF